MTPGEYAQSGPYCDWGVTFDGPIHLAYAPRPAPTGQPPPHQARPVASPLTPVPAPQTPSAPKQARLDPVSRILASQGICDDGV